ncbi:MAG: glycosyltransferase, partial [Actinobacteria bacterium]
MLSRENKSIAAIIPAYNEEKNIAPILEVLKNVNFLDHILIVDDGSKDKTARIAKEAGFEVLELKENQGK